ncbi:hypothetical protein F4780DRAFT_732073 [Xylariomycetidae sp. FL0641]|nr:hypothetical protein F4780DRAFT_732073 [Xylariomycetidae sp. FL0641]
MATIETSYDFTCAKRCSDANGRARQGKFVCKRCRLVMYCHSSCQKRHWKKHRADCESRLIQSNWRPRWEVERRPPAFMGGPPVTMFNNRKKHLWGNMPAFDLLNLVDNEGASYDGEIRLLFAASGDLRNIAKTIAALPASYKSAIHLDVNDFDQDVVARNAIMLMLALIVDDPAVASDYIIHLWYSAFTPPGLVDILQGEIRQRISDVCIKIQNNVLDIPLGQTWIFGQRSLRLVLTKVQWSYLLSRISVSSSLTVAQARANLQSVTLAPERVDCRHRAYYCMSPARRLAAQRFREDGILLPFGSRLTAETWTPNPTIFLDDGAWPLHDSADPLAGWQPSEVFAVPTLASNDSYGQLKLHIKTILSQFHTRVHQLPISFQLLSVDARRLMSYLGNNRYDRIEVSNISDAGYLGIGATLNAIGPLLRKPVDNPCATLVTLFMNAVHETDIHYSRQYLEFQISRLVQILPLTHLPTCDYTADVIFRVRALPYVQDVDLPFKIYMECLDFSWVANNTGMEVKEKHTIIDPWPTRMKKRPDEAGAKEELYMCMSSGQNGTERYVEWKWKPDDRSTGIGNWALWLLVAWLLVCGLARVS